MSAQTMTLTLTDGRSFTGRKEWRHTLNAEAAARALGIKVSEQHFAYLTLIAWSIATQCGEQTPPDFPTLEQALSRGSDNPVADITPGTDEDAKDTDDYVAGMGKDTPTEPSDGGAQ